MRMRSGGHSLGIPCEWRESLCMADRDGALNFRKMHPQQIGQFRIPMADAIGRTQYRHSRRICKMIDQFRQNRRSRGRGTLVVNGSPGYWQAGEYFHCRRSRHRQQAMSAANASAAQFDGTAPDGVHSERMKTK